MELKVDKFSRPNCVHPKTKKEAAKIVAVINQKSLDSGEDWKP